VGATFFAADTDSLCVALHFRTVLSEMHNFKPLDTELEPSDFNAKWPFKIIQGHPYRCRRRATKALHSTI